MASIPAVSTPIGCVAVGQKGKGKEAQVVGSGRWVEQGRRDVGKEQGGKCLWDGKINGAVMCSLVLF